MKRLLTAWLAMKRALAEIHCWFWLLTVGMWKGLCECRVHERGRLVLIGAIDRNGQIRKVFWRAA